MRGVFGLFLATVVVLGCNERRAPKACVPALAGWANSQTGKPVSVLANAVELEGRNIRWNGVPISERTLATYLGMARTMNPLPYLIFDPGVEPDCAFASRIQSLLEREYSCGEVQCWQGSKAEYDEAAYAKPTGLGVP